MLMGVSRQSVTKWEAEKAYPEMDKLLKLRDIFGCTLDELVQGDLTTRPKKPGLGIAEGPAQDVCGYDEHMLGAVPMNNWTNYRFSEEQIKDFIKDVATK